MIFIPNGNSTIHSETGGIVTLRTEYKENKPHKGECIQ